MTRQIAADVVEDEASPRKAVRPSLHELLVEAAERRTRRRSRPTAGETPQQRPERAIREFFSLGSVPQRSEID